MYKNAQVLILSILLISITNLHADVLIVNSNVAEEVSLGGMYSNMMNMKIVFYSEGITSDQLASEINDEKVVIYQSTKHPINVGLQTELETLNINISNIEEYSDMWELNGKLYEEAKDRCSELVYVDPKYGGYNILPLIPYARLKNACVLYTDKDHHKYINATSKKVIYGPMEIDIENVSKRYDNENKYINDFEISKEILNNKLVIFSDGEVIEPSLVSADIPVILVSDVVSNKLINYLINWVNEGKLLGATAIGSEHIATYKRIKDQISSKTSVKFTIMVKFAKGVGGQMLSLDTLKFKGISIGDISLEKISYNKETKQLEVIYHNPSLIPVYIQGQYDIIVNKEKIVSVGDKSPVKIPKNSSYGTSFKIELPSDLQGTILINASYKYGESEDTLYHGKAGQFRVGEVEYRDQSKIEIRYVNYYIENNMLKLTIKNNGEKDVFLRTEFKYKCKGDNSEYSFSNDKINTIPPGENRIFTYTEFAECNLTSGDYHVEYGEREGLLLMKKEGKITIKDVAEKGSEDNNDNNLLAIIGIAILMAITISTLLLRDRNSFRRGRW